MFCLMASLSAQAITWQYDSFNTSSKTCTLVGWAGTQPSSGKLTVKSSYTHSDGVTYTVNCIASNALNDLTEVTQVTIPATIKKIGNSGSQTEEDGINNFLRCPKLEKFVVESGNSKFAATAKGILVSNDATILYKVPEALAFDDGNYKMSSKIDIVSAGSFTDNSTISTITFPAETSVVSRYAGFNTMTQLSKFVVNASNPQLVVKDGALIDISLKYLISYPPMRTNQNVEITYAISSIWTEAFANTNYLKTLTLPSSLRYIYDRAFQNSSITGITLPEGLKYIFEEAFYRSKLKEVTLPSTYNYDSAFPRIFASCKSLTKITAKGKDIRFSTSFARNCANLTTVVAETAPTLVRETAFKNCPQLTTFPFSVKTCFSGDSIFANTGFTTVKFPNETPGESVFTSTRDMFAQCTSLSIIDFSALEDNYIAIPIDFATNCRNLNLVRLSNNVSFVAKASSIFTTNFGPNVPIKKFVIGDFNVFDHAKVVNFSGAGTNTPRTFVKNTKCNSSGMPTAPKSPMEYFYAASNGAVVNPEFYCESSLAPKTHYVDPNATYFVPGGCTDNYSQAVTGSKGVTELFDLTAENFEGKIRMKIKTPFNYVTISHVMFNDVVQANPDYAGTISTYMEYDKVKTVRVFYTVYGENMQTVYALESIPNSGVNDIADGMSSLDINIYDNNLIVTGAISTPRYEVYDLNGVSVMSGNGTSADLSSLHPGAYIVKVADMKGQVTDKFMLN